MKISETMNTISEDTKKLQNIIDGRENFIDQNEKWRCGQCGEIRLEDKRVEAKLKCFVCAYL